MLRRSKSSNLELRHKLWAQECRLSQLHEHLLEEEDLYWKDMWSKTTLRDFTIGMTIPNDGWLQITIIKGKVQQEAIHIFYSNIHNTDSH